jgi:hypothetical protein
MPAASIAQPLKEFTQLVQNSRVRGAISLPSCCGSTRDMATIRDKVGHLETLSRDLLNARLDPSLIFNHLDTMNAGPNFFSITAPRKKAGL